VTVTIYGLSLLAGGGGALLVYGGWAWSLVPVLLARSFWWFFRDPAADSAQARA